MRDLRDMRDPEALGLTLLGLRTTEREGTLSELADRALSRFTIKRTYSHEGPLEKYGDPRELRSTLPN